MKCLPQGTPPMLVGTQQLIFCFGGSGWEMKKTKAAAGAAGWNFSISTRRPWNEEIEHISSGHFDTGRLFNGRPTDGDHHQSELIANWGPPQQIMDDGQGGKIFIYSATRNHTTQGRATTNVTGSAYSVGDFTYGNATGHTTYTPPQTSSYTAHRMFWINSNGYVYRWAWRGL